MRQRQLRDLTVSAIGLGCTPAQPALARLLHQDEHAAPIPGTRRVSRLEENAATAGDRYANMSVVEL
jgi:aryl-alcohol dehydrogenase-like predicted oxidoreductase